MIYMTIGLALLGVFVVGVVVWTLKHPKAAETIAQDAQKVEQKVQENL